MATQIDFEGLARLQTLKVFVVATRVLRDLGRASARAWLTQCYASLGVVSTVDIKQDYLDDLRIPVTSR